MANLTEKARAAQNAERPDGDGCRDDRGAFQPVVDRAKCEGKADCVDACPYDVFEIRRMDDVDFAHLSLFHRLKSMAHGRKTAYTPRADQCRACGLCVAACPEKAVSLVRPIRLTFRPTSVARRTWG
jgi:NAD-dependent dihydropyrimidine dehydrogenase PreA subunit